MIKKEHLHHWHYMTYIAQTWLIDNNVREKLGHAQNISY